MNISYKGDYSLKIILDLALNYPDNLVHIEDIAKRQDIPKKFLEQILLQLKRGGYVESKKGPNGGYYLTKSPEKITLGEVVRFIEGPIHPISCIDPDVPKTCDDSSRCVFYPVWNEVSDAISRIIDNVNFSDLRENYKKMIDNKVFIYHI